jgi:uncharacterized RDD family membrane protein YckC
MYPPELPPYRRFPKVPIERRAYAFLIDFVIVWLISSFAGTGWLKFIVFMGLWFFCRVVVVERNKGQSLGSWSLDIKVIDLRFKKIPGIVELSKREGIIGILALFAMIGLEIGLLNSITMLLLITPLLVDCGIALGDEEFNQAFHDRVAGTVVIQSKRGFSLDLRLKKIFQEIRQNFRK